MVVVESAGECVVSLEAEVSCRFQPNGGQGSGGLCVALLMSSHSIVDPNALSHLNR
jgi:hypothetical protein